MKNPKEKNKSFKNFLKYFKKFQETNKVFNFHVLFSRLESRTVR